MAKEDSKMEGKLADDDLSADEPETAGMLRPSKGSKASIVPRKEEGFVVKKVEEKDLSKDLDVNVNTDENTGGRGSKVDVDLDVRSVIEPFMLVVDGTEETEGGGRKEKKGWRSHWMGVALTLFSGLMLSFVALLVKYLQDYHPLSLGFFRFSGIIFPCIPILTYYICRGQPLLTPLCPLSSPGHCKNNAILIGRGVVGCLAVMSQFASIQYLTVGDAIVVGSVSPVFVKIMAYLTLGEKCGIFPMFTAVMVIVGVVVIARPPLLTGEQAYDPNALIGIGYALARMLLNSMAIVLIRALRGLNFAVVILVTGVIQLTLSSSLALILGVFALPTDPHHLVLACLLGGTSFLSQMGITLALKCEQAGPFALLRTCDVLFAFLVQFIFLGVVPDVFSLIGGLVVLSAVCLTIFRNWLMALPEDNPARHRYSIILK